MYRGNGAGGWVSGPAEPVGSGWGGFTALAAGGDFSGDGKADVLARESSGALFLYRGDGASGWLAPQHEQDRHGLERSVAPHARARFPTARGAFARPGPGAGPAPAAPLPDGNVSLDAGIRYTPPGGLLRASVKVRKRAGRPAARVQRIVFYVRNGPRRIDHRRPYAVRLRMHRAAGTKATPACTSAARAERSSTPRRYSGAS
jgi:hypothetical protein